jgi:hypothetical protein
MCKVFFMRKWWKTKFIVAAFTLCHYAQALSEDLYVITNPGLSVEPATVKSIFLGETEFSGSVKLEVTDNTAAQAVFLRKVMAMDKAKYEALWMKKSFRDGVIQPVQRGSDAEVIDFVKHTPGAIGFVITVPAGVNVIQQY